MLGEAPAEEGAAVDGVLEPVGQFRRDVAIEEDLDRALGFAREFAHLQFAGVRGGFPVHVARALESVVRPNAIEVLAQALVVRFDIAGDAGQQILETPRAASMEG